MNRWDRMRPYQWRRLQDRKLKEYLQHEVLPYHAFYRERAKARGINFADITSVEKLQQCPELITQKADIVGHDREFVLQPTFSRMARHDPVKIFGVAIRGMGRPKTIRRKLRMEYFPVVPTATTGRSGAQTFFLFTNPDVRGFVGTSARRAFEMLGIPDEGRGISLFPAAAHLAHVFVVYGAMEVPALVAPLLGLRTEERIDRIEKSKAAVLFGVPGYIDRVLARAAKQGKDFSSIQCVVVGGAGISEAQRVRMKEALSVMGSPHAVIVSSYGFTEARIAFIECIEGARKGMDVGYHTYPDLGIVETVRFTEHEDGSIKTVMPCEELEEGEVLYTPLEGHGSVVLRWRTKDLARLTHSPCPACGRSLPRILGPIRRRSKDMLKNVKATLVDFAEVEIMLDKDPAVVAWQIVIESRDDNEFLTAYIAFRDDENTESASVRIRTEFKVETQISLDKIVAEPYETVIKRLGTDTELKERRIVDLRTEA